MTVDSSRRSRPTSTSDRHGRNAAPRRAYSRTVRSNIRRRQRNLGHVRIDGSSDPSSRLAGYGRRSRRRCRRPPVRPRGSGERAPTEPRYVRGRERCVRSRPQSDASRMTIVRAYAPGSIFGLAEPRYRIRPQPASCSRRDPAGATVKRTACTVRTSAGPCGKRSARLRRTMYSSTA
jgi:hypothetical protein